MKKKISLIKTLNEFGQKNFVQFWAQSPRIYLIEFTYFIFEIDLEGSSEEL